MLKRSLLKTSLFLLALVPLSLGAIQEKKIIKVFADDVSSYYEEIEKNKDTLTDGENGTLRKALTKLCYPAAFYTYSGSNPGQLGYELQFADEDPNNSENMIMFYTQNSIKKITGSTGSTVNWTREHAWPQNNSAGLYGKREGGTDILHLRPAYQSVNSSRQDFKYGELDPTTSTKKEYLGMPYGYTKNSIFMPLDEIKGDVARICFYMWTEYFYKHPSEESPTPITNNFDSVETAIKWHLADTPSPLEISRNNFAQAGKQKNRNPYVDHPEYVCRVWGNISDEARRLCSTSTVITIKNYPGDLKVNDEYQLQVEVKSGVQGETTYASSDTNVATISSTGLIKAIGVGKSKITVSNNGVSTDFEVVVREEGTTPEIIIKTTQSELKVNDELQLEVEFKGEKTTAFAYASSDTNVATVSDTGLIKAINPGKSLITVASSGLSKNFELTVKSGGDVPSTNNTAMIVLAISIPSVIFVFGVGTFVFVKFRKRKIK